MRLVIAAAVVMLTVGLAVGTALAGEAVGKIQKIDMDQKMFVLEDGTQLWLAEGADTGKLKEGAKVKVVYAERDGKKWMSGTGGGLCPPPPALLGRANVTTTDADCQRV